MPPPPMTAADLSRFGKLLREERAKSDAEQRLLSESLDVVRAARSDGTADDEHDPDGPTLSAEWSRVSGLHAELAAKSAAIDRALERIAGGTYGLCLRCRRAIVRGRLGARPAAEFCIDCARELEARH